MEHKLTPIDLLDVKFDEARKGFFNGYASVFGGVDSYGDSVLPGAYAKTIADRKRPIQLRWNHRGEVIGKWIGIREDEKGLFVEGELTPGHSKAQDVAALMKHGAVTGLSIGYRPIEFTKNTNGGLDLKEIELIEISVVESPADNAAHIAEIKSAIEEAESLKEIESLLRDAGGFSRTDAKALLARMKSLSLRDAEAESKTSDLLASIRAATLKISGV